MNRELNTDLEKEAESNKYVSKSSILEAILDFFKVAVIPFSISTILSLLTLFESKKWNPVLISARDEFIQITGLKLSFYIIIFLVGISFIFYSIDSISGVIARFVSLVSNVGFVINAVLAGVFSGVIFSGFFGIESNISTRFKFEFYIIVFTLFVVFYGSTKVLPNRVKKDITEILEKPIAWFIPFLFGMALIIFGTYVLSIEEWCELAESQNKVACKITN